jgi:hypothetical protein
MRAEVRSENLLAEPPHWASTQDGDLTFNRFDRATFNFSCRANNILIRRDRVSNHYKNLDCAWK